MSILQLTGTCRGAAHGIYYVDDRSFAYCSNGIKTIQSCADGSANPPYAKFEKGKYYQFAEFCSVNLVAQQKVRVATFMHIYFTVNIFIRGAQEKQKGTLE